MSIYDFKNTGMSWNPKTPRPSDEDVLSSPLAEPIKRLRGLPCIRPCDVDDKSDNDTHLLRCTLLIGRVLHTPVWIDQEYTYDGILELQDNSLVYGNGPYAPGLRCLSEKINEDPTGKLHDDPAVIMHAPDAMTVMVRDLQIDGNQSAVDWDHVKSDQLSNTLRNSPSFAGLALHNQNRRPFPKRAYLDRLHIHDFPSSCALLLCRVNASELILGNSVSGRILYRVSGCINGLHTYGFSRTSVARVNAPIVVNNWTYRRDGHENPWPENAYQENIAAIERMQDGLAVLHGIDWEGDGSGFAKGLAVGGSCEASGSIRNFSPAVYAHPKLSSPVDADIRISTENCRNMVDLSAYRHPWFRQATIRIVNHESKRRYSDIDWSPTPGAYQQWNKEVNAPVSVSVARTPQHPLDYRQEINIHIDDHWPRWTLIHLPDAAHQVGGRFVLRPPGQVVPTVIRLSGRVENVLSTWVSLAPGITQQVEATPAELAMFPVEIVVDNMACNRVPPGLFVGDKKHTVHAGLLNVRQLTKV